MSGLNAKKLVVNHMSKFYIYKKNKTLLAYLIVFVYPPSLTPCSLIYLYINPSDLTLPQIT